MRVTTVENIFSALAEHGLERRPVLHGAEYAFRPGRGEGGLMLTGLADWWCHLEFDGECARGFEAECDLTEPFICIPVKGSIPEGVRLPYPVLGINPEPCPDSSDSGDEPNPGDDNSHGNSYEKIGPFFINTCGLRGILSIPARSRVKLELLLVRAQAYSQYLFPPLMHHPADDMLGLIAQAGSNSSAYLARALASFRLSGYRGEALKMQLNSLVTGIFTEIIHQADRLAGGQYIHQPGEGRRITEADRRAVEKSRDILRESLKEAPTIDDLARKVGVNRTKLQMCFQELCGTTIGNFTRICRMERAMELLKTDMPITDIAHEVGYASPSKFAKAFSAMFAVSPRDFRAQSEKL